MPAKWTAEADFKVLLFAVKNSDVKLEKEAFDTIAAMLGDGTNANAVS